MANLARGGFRWRFNRSAPASTSPPIRIIPVATSNAAPLYKGDVVKMDSNGYLLAASPGDAVCGVFDGMEQYWDGTVIRKGASLPVTTAYGSNLSRQSLARVIDARGQVFEVDADDNVTFTTQAGYQAAVGENCEWVAGTHIGDQSGSQLDIATHAVTATLTCRIFDIPSQASLQDFAATNVKIHIVFNLIQDGAPGVALGV